MLGDAETLSICRPALLDKSHLLVGITRVRNEDGILRDTLDHVGAFVDAIVAFDDASTDATREILRSHPKVAILIQSDHWEAGIQARLLAETRHRGLLLDVVRQRLPCEWIYCFDADERLVGDVRGFLTAAPRDECDGVRVSLFDAYLTPDDHAPLGPGNKLCDGRRFFGPERRDILMLWRNLPGVRFEGLDAREPTGVGQTVTYLRCQHYGKAISVEQWEATCDYYMAHFPAETYGRKWARRKGHAVHILSDFGYPLTPWGPELFNAALPMSASHVQTDWPTTELGAGGYDILLATNHLQGWTGSETLLLALIDSLLNGGCRVAVYARYLDRDWVRPWVRPDVLLVDDPDALRPLRFDLAHVQHASCLVDVRSLFPRMPVLFSSLGVLPFLEQPPPLAMGVTHYLAISEEVESNLTAQGVPSARISVLRNLVCSERFRPQSQIRSRPERILVLSYKVDDARKIVLRAAAKVIGASITFVGDVRASSQDDVVTHINDADVVVSLGRGVIEAMLCGRVPLVFDVHGGDGLVTPDNLEQLMKVNFSGRLYRRECSVAELVDQLLLYEQSFGFRLREIAERRFSLSSNIGELMKLHREVIANPAAVPETSTPPIAFASTLARQDLGNYRVQRTRADAFVNEVQRIKSTVSWRITAPLRLLWNIPKRFLKRISR
ncbi:MAG: glycosyltransferase family 2 protein [Hylemonella sp.]|nr:glycosyltransferase family 2 protein [Hylemonella sp.]